MLRFLVAVAVLSIASQSALSARALSRADTETSMNSTSNRGDASKQFSVVANQALTNLSTQMSQFQRMITARSSQLQTDLQGRETANDEIEEANTRIQASNMKLEADNHASERRARTLANANKKLRSEVHCLEEQLQTARAMAAAVASFASQDTSKEADESVGIETALLAISAETEALAEGTRFLVQQEKLSVSNLQHSFESAVVSVKQRKIQLVEAQGQLNATHTQLVARRAHLMKLLAKLQAAHNHMQRRAQKLGSFLRQLAGIAAHPKAAPQAATAEQPAAQQPQALKESPQPQQQQQQQQQPQQPQPPEQQQQQQQKQQQLPARPARTVALQVGHKGKKRKKAQEEDASQAFDSVLNQLHR